MGIILGGGLGAAKDRVKNNLSLGTRKRLFM
jgi:hypothetical protein